MSSTETTFDGAETGAASARTKLACRIVSARLRRLSAGSIKVTLPGGGKLGVYQPRHARPKAARARPGAAKRAGRNRAGAKGTRVKTRARTKAKKRKAKLKSSLTLMV